MAGGSAEAKARQRERNRAAAAIHGTTPSRSGSSGLSALLLDMERKSWDQLQDGAVHVADFQGSMSGVQITAAGTLMVQISGPLEYLHQMSDVVIAARGQAVVIRVYVVTPETIAARNRQ